MLINIWNNAFIEWHSFAINIFAFIILVKINQKGYLNLFELGYQTWAEH